MEEWKDINGYEGLYQVSSFGRVKSLKFGKEKILKTTTANKGYEQLSLTKNGKCKTYKVHRLVCESFIPNTENKPCIDHINTIRTDNRVDNLRWVTHTENCNNPISKTHYSKCRKGELNHNSKPIIQFSLNGEFIRKYKFMNEIEFNHSHISDCCLGKRKTAYGFIWKYYDLELYLESKLFKTYGIKNKMVA